jgi:rRNA maturation endonuclease Nob1
MSLNNLMLAMRIRLVEDVIVLIVVVVIIVAAVYLAYRLLKRKKSARYCANCGRPVSGSSTFCEHCGAKLM